jgi:hypothetical protein
MLLEARPAALTSFPGRVRGAAGDGLPMVVQTGVPDYVCAATVARHLPDRTPPPQCGCILLAVLTIRHAGRLFGGGGCCSLIDIASRISATNSRWGDAEAEGPNDATTPWGKCTGYRVYRAPAGELGVGLIIVCEM